MAAITTNRRDDRARGSNTASDSTRRIRGLALDPTFWLAIVTAVLQCPAPRSDAATYYLDPHDAGGHCDEPFEDRANALLPGDELVLRAGVYTQSCTRSIRVRGTAEQPIVIRAAEGADVLLTRPAENMSTHNNIEIVDSAHLVVRGLRFGGGNIGVRFMGGHDIVFEDNEVFGTGVSAITMNVGDHRRMLLRRNHIHHSGLLDGDDVTGEGIYVGCNDAACRVSDSVFRDNHVHHLRATADGGNDGIEIKPGSGGNLVAGNYIHDTVIGRRFPCIFVYGGADRPNVVENNIVHDCGEGIQVVADAVVRGNLVFDSRISGITVQPHAQVGPVRNVTITANTVWGHPACVRLDWRGARDVRLLGNALLCGGQRALRGRGLAQATVAHNVAAGGRPDDAIGLQPTASPDWLTAGLPVSLRAREARAWRRLAERRSPSLDLDGDGAIGITDATLVKRRLFLGVTGTTFGAPAPGGD